MRGPNLSCSRPAGIIVMAKNAHIVEYGSAMSALLQPHDAGMPARTTLQMYRTPRTRPVSAAAVVTSQPR